MPAVKDRWFLTENKKGQTWTLREIVVIVFVAFIVLATFGFFNELYTAVFSQKDDGSIANFERLYNNVKELLESTSASDYRVINYFIGQDKILVGFDTYWNEEKRIVQGNIFGLIGSYNIYKSFKCGNAACLCVYTKEYKPGDAAKRDVGVLSCRSEAFTNKDIVFISEGGNVNPKTKGIEREDKTGNYLVFYGDEWKIQEIYIEKFVSGGKTYVYISKIDTTKSDDPANIRKKQIDSSRKSSTA